MSKTPSHEHYQRVWRLLRPLGALLARLVYGFTAELRHVEGPFLLVSNHQTDWDPILVGSGFRSQMYFVASEHILRHGFVSSLLRYLMAPIARQKGGNAAGTVKAILRTLREGKNVALFPEGNRTWDGLTGAIPPATGKMARASGAKLVTYRLEGGYLTSPRWAGSSVRKGRMTGRIVGIYSPEELRQMTASQVDELIRRDLAQDDRLVPESTGARFRGGKAAEHLETFLFLCPECGCSHTLRSSGDVFRCTSCGSSSRYTDSGTLEGDFRFNCVRDWACWQEENLQDLIDAAGENAIFTDRDLRLLEVTTARRGTEMGTGSLTLYADRLELPGGITVPLKEISGMSIRGASVLFVGTSGGHVYQLIPRGVCNTEKYVLACRRMGVIDIAV